MSAVRRKSVYRVVFVRNARENKNPAQHLLTFLRISWTYSKARRVDGDTSAPADAKARIRSMRLTENSCMTTDGKALTRIFALSTLTGKVVYDQLVRPPTLITVYLTRISGITAAVLTRTLADVQTHLHMRITSTILLLHSLAYGVSCNDAAARMPFSTPIPLHPAGSECRTRKAYKSFVGLLIPGLTSTVLSLSPFPTSASAIENPNLAIPIPLRPYPPPPTRSHPPDPLSSVELHSEEAATL
ncbi:hypothetical protein V8E53_000134 [Lactarius tabidus]